MAADLYGILRCELKPGETLLWKGYCLSELGKQHKEVGPDNYAIVGAIGGFLVGLVPTWMTSGYGLPILLLSIPLGAFLGFTRIPVSSAYRKSRTIYAVTNRRLLVLRDLPGDRQVKSLPMEFLAGISAYGQDQLSAGPTNAVKDSSRATIQFRAACTTHRCTSETALRFFMTGEPSAAVRLVLHALFLLRIRQEQITKVAQEG